MNIGLLTFLPLQVEEVDVVGEVVETGVVVEVIEEAEVTEVVVEGADISKDRGVDISKDKGVDISKVVLNILEHLMMLDNLSLVGVSKQVINSIKVDFKLGGIKEGTSKGVISNKGVISSKEGISKGGTRVKAEGIEGGGVAEGAGVEAGEDD